MNIFVLDKNPALAAQMHADSHVTKMILESAQLLSTAVRTFDPYASLYKMAFRNHPCAKWARESSANFDWLVALGVHLNDEYFFRYGREHKSFEIILQAKLYHEYLIPDGNLTPFIQAMPDEYKVPNDPVQAYRNYYRNAKRHLLIYTKRQPPKWIEDIAKYKQM